MAKTPEEIKEQNRIRERERRRKNKELGIKSENPQQVFNRVKKFKEGKKEISFLAENEIAENLKQVCKDKNLSYLEFFRVYSSKKLIIKLNDYNDMSSINEKLSKIIKKCWNNYEGYFNLMIFYIKDDLDSNDIKLLESLKKSLIVDYLIK